MNSRTAFVTVLVFPLLAGCTNGPAPTGPVLESMVAAPTVERYDYNGSIGRQVCLPTGPSTCGRVIWEGASNVDYRVDVSKQRIGIIAIIYWNSTQATTTEFRLQVLSEKNNCNNCYEKLAERRGASPLNLSIPVIELGEGVEAIEIWVDASPSGTPPVTFLVHEPESFHATLELAVWGTS